MGIVILRVLTVAYLKSLIVSMDSPEVDWETKSQMWVVLQTRVPYEVPNKVRHPYKKGPPKKGPQFRELPVCWRSLLPVCWRSLSRFALHPATVEASRVL